MNDPVAEILQGLDAIRTAYGSMATMDDRDGRLLIARKLADRVAIAGTLELAEQVPDVRFVAVTGVGYAIVAIDTEGQCWQKDCGDTKWVRLPGPLFEVRD